MNFFNGSCKMHRFQASCRWMFFFMLIVLFSACSDSRKTSPEPITPAKITAEMHQEILTIIPDHDRAQKVIALTDQLNIIIVDAVHERDKDLARLESLNANYDASKVEFETWLAMMNSQDKQRYMKVLAINTEMKKILTAEEWKELQGIRKEILKKDLKLL